MKHTEQTQKHWLLSHPTTSLPSNSLAYRALQFAPQLPDIQIGDYVALWFKDFSPISADEALDCIVAWADEQLSPRVNISVEISQAHEFVKIRRLPLENAGA